MVTKNTIYKDKPISNISLNTAMRSIQNDSLKMGFWAPKWEDAVNIWQPIGYYNHVHSSQTEQQYIYPKPSESRVSNYVSTYMKTMWGVDVKDYSRYVHAFTHKSYQSDDPNSNTNNERLEFLGDSVLQSVITEYIFNRFENKSEGFLTKIRMKMINGETLADIGNKLKLPKMIRVSPRLKSINKKLIEDAFEAIVCVIYQEHGLSYVRDRLINIYEKNINFEEIVVDNNYKEILLKHAQNTKKHESTHTYSGGSPVEYTLVDTVGPSHSKLFRIQVVYNGKKLGVGMGTTRRSGEQAAARETLTILGISHTLIDS